MKKIWIIGAGGWGREVAPLVRAQAEHGTAWTLQGFLDNRAHMLNGVDSQGLAIHGDPLAHVPQPDELFVCALGEPAARQRYTRAILDQGGQFISVIPPCTHLPAGVHIAPGCIFSPGVRISIDVHLGAFTNIHSFAVLGHDVRTGPYCQISALSFLGGGVRLGEQVTIHPNATILPGLHIGDGASVGAGAVVLKDVPAGATVFGNPARVIFHRGDLR